MHEDEDRVSSNGGQPSEPDAETPPPASSASDGTGLDVADDVVASMDGLADLPVGEHVEVFDRAHRRLREALDDAGRDGTPDES